MTSGIFPTWFSDELDFYLMIFSKLLTGVPTTLQLAIYSVFMGFFFALCLALMSRSKIGPVSALARGYIFTFRGTPMLIQLFLIYYGMGQFRPFLQEINLWWFFRDVYYCAILGLTMNTAAYGAEIIRGGLQSVPHGQIEAARAAGMSGFTLYRRIIFPIALRQALPGYTNEIILMIKDTSLASLITLVEITQLADGLRSQTFRPVAVYTCAGVIYLLINFVVTWLVGRAEYRLNRHLRPIKVATV
ncbi:ABC transporter permease [Microvirga sp. W0021]|uniref:ABC transporter permease n=1 Tax=Hohaiivirga grylli TaxID=3133970 RepID=A0ABV0BMM4_9HYPH